MTPNSPTNFKNKNKNRAGGTAIPRLEDVVPEEVEEERVRWDPKQ